jgi:hypothetical protein
MRTFVEDPPPMRFAPFPRRYGCVWPEGNAFAAYYEVPRPGEIEDVDLGKFATEGEARRAVEAALEAPSLGGGDL